MKCKHLLSFSQNDVHPTIESTLGFFNGRNHTIRKSDYCQIRFHQNIVLSESFEVLMWLSD